MTQYTNDTPIEEVRDKSTLQIDMRRQIAQLNDQIDRQHRDISALARELKRLKNELRVAVNAFNLKNHG